MKKFSPHGEDPEVISGGKVRRWVFVAGNLEVIRYEYDKGAFFPEHSHPSEQVTAVVEGELTFRVAGEDVILREGEILYIPPDVSHGATATGTSTTKTLNVFNPARKERP